MNKVKYKNERQKNKTKTKKSLGQLCPFDAHATFSHDGQRDSPSLTNSPIRFSRLLHHCGSH